MKDTREAAQTYSDAGKSGLKLAGRDALRQLIHDVESGNAHFDAILVYDVSRWGRLQDPDESAYYEYPASARILPFIVVPSLSRTTAAYPRHCSRP